MVVGSDDSVVEKRTIWGPGT